MGGIITLFQPPSSLPDLEYCYNLGKTNLEFLFEDSKEYCTEWTVNRGSKKDDLVFFYCAATAKNRLGKACSEAKQAGRQELVDFAEKEKILYKQYSGSIIAWGKLITEPYQVHDEDVLGWKSPWYGIIQIFEVFETPIPYSSFKQFCEINSYGAITTLSDEKCAMLEQLVSDYSNVKVTEESVVVIPDSTYTEGRRVEIYGHKYERDAKVRKAFLNTQKKPYHCEVCGFDFEKIYGELGKDYIEVHHRTPLFVNDVEQEIHMTDLACLCSNCHRMIHRKRGKIMTVEELRAVVFPGKG